MTARAVMIAAPASGQGKTTVAAALARALADSGQRVVVFKVGPDFLDPMILRAAGRCEVEPLDLWMVGADDCRRQVAAVAGRADWVIVEAAMGLYDGNPSAADLATTLGLPIALVIDAHGMAQTFAAVAHGLATHRPVHICGAIANRVAGESHAQMVRANLPDAIPWLFAMPRQNASFPARHLGLVIADEVADLDEQLGRLGAVIDPPVLSRLAEYVPRYEPPAEPTPPDEPPTRALTGHIVAVARDAAFAFLYLANLRCLESLGAEVVSFSPLADEIVSNADSVYLVGGYPELHAARLAGAARFRQWIRSHATAGKSIWAECGGLMALCERLTLVNGERYPMMGVLPGEAIMTPRLAGLGLQSITLPSGTLRGHAFHYGRVETTLPAQVVAVRHPYGTPGEAVYRMGGITASFFHAWFPSCPAAAGGLLSTRPSRSTRLQGGY